MATRQNRARDDYQTPPQLMVDSVLLTLTDLPRGERAAALRASLELHRALRASRPTPEWVAMLADLAEKESGTT